MSSSVFLRRTFLKQAAAAPFFIPNLFSSPPNGTLRLASFGADGMAYATLHGIATHRKVKLVCVAEVDSARLRRLKQNYPEARVYEDWRVMLAKERKNLDIACIGTPDHMHAPMAMGAMREGLHVYLQKPLCHDLYETRRITEMARKKKLVTQMGIQIHSAPEYRTAVALIQSGGIGKVKEVHAWSEKKWGDTAPVPQHADPVPPGLNWDLWLGVAAARPYIKDYYHPGDWRKRIDFGTATFGDMGCHIYDPVFEALQLTAPLTVRSSGPVPGPQNWAIDAVIRYTFPGTEYSSGKTVDVTWYDGDQRPPREIMALIGAIPVPGQGSIFIGEKGVMLLPHIGVPVLLPEANYRGFAMPKVEPANHYHQFVEAVLGNGKTSTSFDYSGALTEAVLLGPVATRFPNLSLEWNRRKLKFTNSAEANAFVRRRYRGGWSVKGLS